MKQLSLFEIYEPKNKIANFEEIKELINRRRRQILVHSCIYYRMNSNIWSDESFDEKARELVELQKQYPDIASECIYAKEFKVFDATTGYDLPFTDIWIEHKAKQLLEYSTK